MNMVESCNEHMRKLIEIWSKTPPYPKLINLIDILENLGCEDAIAELRECLEVSFLKGEKSSRPIKLTLGH